MAGKNLDHYLSTIVSVARELAGQRWFAVREYDLSVTTDPAARGLCADVVLTVEVTSPARGPIIAFLGVPLMSAFNIKAVTLDGVPTAHSYAAPRLEVQLPRTVEAGETLMLGITYSGTVAAPQTYVTRAGTELSYEGLWVPVLNFPGLRFHARASLNVPAGEVCAFTGNEVVRCERNGRVLSYWETDVPVTHLTMVSGPFETHELGFNDTQVRVIAQPAHSQAALATTELVLDVVKIGTEWFGPLVNHEVQLAYTPRRQYGHYTHVPLLVLNASLASEIDELAKHFVRLIAWDLGHFWWGYAVRTDLAHEGWLSDGLAGFLALLALEERCGSEVAARYLQDLARTLDQLGQTPPLATIAVDHPRYPTISRCRSLLCLASLRQQLGDIVLQECTRALYSTHCGAVMRTDDLIDGLLRVANKKDLEAYIMVQLYEPVRYRVSDDGTITPILL